MQGGQGFKKKKNSNKNIPVDELGFKPKVMWDVIDPRDPKTKLRKGRTYPLTYAAKNTPMKPTRKTSSKDLR